MIIITIIINLVITAVVIIIQEGQSLDLFLGYGSVFRCCSAWLGQVSSVVRVNPHYGIMAAFLPSLRGECVGPSVGVSTAQGSARSSAVLVVERRQRYRCVQMAILSTGM